MWEGCKVRPKGTCYLWRDGKGARISCMVMKVGVVRAIGNRKGKTRLAVV